MNFADRERTRPKLNIAPLIDVVFLLLIFFMLASSFVEPAAIDLSMPQSDRAAGAGGGDPLVVDVAVGGEIRLNGLVLSIDQLGPELTGRVGGALERPVTVRAETSVAVQRLVAVMDQVREAGLKNIRLATPSAP